jgi:hypothetical protein
MYVSSHTYKHSQIQIRTRACTRAHTVTHTHTHIHIHGKQHLLLPRRRTAHTMPSKRHPRATQSRARSNSESQHVHSGQRLVKQLHTLHARHSDSPHASASLRRGPVYAPTHAHCAKFAARGQLCSGTPPRVPCKYRRKDNILEQSGGRDGGSRCCSSREKKNVAGVCVRVYRGIDSVYMWPSDDVCIVLKIAPKHACGKVGVYILPKDCCIEFSGNDVCVHTGNHSVSFSPPAMASCASNICTFLYIHI